MICDFAETYHIFNIYQLPVELAATLAIGLRSDARIMLKASGLKVDMKTLLLAHVVDNTAINYYIQTKDAKTGRNKPKSMVKALTSDLDDSKHAKKYDSGEEFLDEWRAINGN